MKLATTFILARLKLKAKERYMVTKLAFFDHVGQIHLVLYEGIRAKDRTRFFPRDGISWRQ